MTTAAFEARVKARADRLAREYRRLDHAMQLIRARSCECTTVVTAPCSGCRELNSHVSQLRRMASERAGGVS